MILEKAVRFFSDKGFSAQVTELAAQLGISHGLIFRYFGTKKRLIDLVYHRVFVETWSDDWLESLADRSIPLKKRIEEFYLSLLVAVDKPEWIRLSLHAALADQHLPRGRLLRGRIEHALKIILGELREYQGNSSRKRLSASEWELAFHLHSSMVYLLMRKYILDFQPEKIPSRITAIQTVVDNFFAGLRKRRTPRS